MNESPTNATSAPAAVWAKAPYYSEYAGPANYFQTRLFEWQEGTAPPTPSGDRPVIEMVTSPNNPDGALRTAEVSPSEHTYTVYDHAYYWPHFTPTATPVTEHLTSNRSVALFTLSKLTGHASTRIGWAVCRCPEVARLMREFVKLNTMHVPRESQLRAAAVLGHVVDTKGQLFGYARTLMASRWERLQACMAGSTVFALQPLEDATKDSFSGLDQYAPSPAYAWVEQLDGGDAAKSMQVGCIGLQAGCVGLQAECVGLQARPSG